MEAKDGAIGTAAAKAQIKPKAAILIDDRMPRVGELWTIGTTVARINHNPRSEESSSYS